MQTRKIIPFICFLIAESILYYFILTAGGQTLVITSYASIVLCFLFALQGIKTRPLMVAGLLCTVGADFCLVICSPIEQLWGMVFFLGAQTLYAIQLHKQQKNNIILLIRMILNVVAALVAVLVLKENLDALAMVSVCYYANLIMFGFLTHLGQNLNFFFWPMRFFKILCPIILALSLASFLSLPASQPFHQMQVVVRAQFLSSSTIGGSQRTCLLWEVLLSVVRYLAV